MCVSSCVNKQSRKHVPKMYDEEQDVERNTQVASLPQEGGTSRVDVDHLQHLQHGSLWHLLKAKTLAPPSVTTTTSTETGAATCTSPPTSPHAAAVVEVSRVLELKEQEQEQEGEVTTTLSLRAVLHEASALAALLRSEGCVDVGDRVAILLRNSPLFSVAQYAVAGAGAVAVNCNTRLTAAELRVIFINAGVKVVIADEDFAQSLAIALRPPTSVASGDVVGTGSFDNAGGDTSARNTLPEISPSSVMVLWAPAVRQQQLEASNVAATSESVAISPPAVAKSAVVPSGSHFASSTSSPAPSTVFERQRRLVFDSAAYELFCAVDDVEEEKSLSSSNQGKDIDRGGGHGRVSMFLRLPWTPEEEDNGEGGKPQELGARYFQMMFTSGTTVGRGGINFDFTRRRFVRMSACMFSVRICTMTFGCVAQIRCVRLISS